MYIHFTPQKAILHLPKYMKHLKFIPGMSPKKPLKKKRIGSNERENCTVQFPPWC